jgi:hypothetical protein
MTHTSLSAKQRHDYDVIGETAKALRNGRFQPQFVQEANVVEKLSLGEHHQKLEVALAKGRLSVEKALIKAAEDGHMIHFLHLAIDLNVIRNLQWKVEQDNKVR